MKKKTFSKYVQRVFLTYKIAERKIAKLVSEEIVGESDTFQINRFATICSCCKRPCRKWAQFGSHGIARISTLYVIYLMLTVTPVIMGLGAA